MTECIFNALAFLFILSSNFLTASIGVGYIGASMYSVDKKKSESKKKVLQ